MRGDLTIRKTRTASGATAVQVVRYESRCCIVVKHMGSAHDGDSPSLLLADATRHAEQHRDVTTLYFESFKEYDFQRPGFFKDNQPQQPQIVIGLITTRSGLPLNLTTLGPILIASVLRLYRLGACLRSLPRGQ
jgi:hypothetical protein